LKRPEDLVLRVAVFPIPFAAYIAAAEKWAVPARYRLSGRSALEFNARNIFADKTATFAASVSERMNNHSLTLAGTRQPTRSYAVRQTSPNEMDARVAAGVPACQGEA
jgi:hypothetical protein